MAASTAALPASAASVKLIHAFGKTTQGDIPTGGLLAIGNLFYGVTASGGKASSECGQFRCGVVFSLTRNGHETVLHQFNGKDGYLPAGGLVALNGVLYGTTMSGGSSKHGTIYSITPQGDFSTIYSFSGVGDGSAPVNSMVAVGNVLYGATASGGLNNNGTAFSITPSGAFTSLYKFGAAGDVGTPEAPYIEYQGLLYGTSSFGGAANNGTIFTLTPAGAETVLHSFATGEGANPAASLTAFNGVLYGTTVNGGASNAGTIFSVTTDGSLATLYSFPNQPDSAGYAPSTNLIAANRSFYGAAEYGGNAPTCRTGCGTVFSITPNGAFTQLYVFTNQNAIQGFPTGPLIAVGSTIYGVASFGDGAVYAFTP